ncbi:hypothetical protein [Nonomuraea sp. bgisy101]
MLARLATAVTATVLATQSDEGLSGCRAGLWTVVAITLLRAAAMRSASIR